MAARHRLLASALALVTAAGACTAAPAAEPAKPNIIFFLVDDFSADLLPYLDTVNGLADGGARFDNYVVSNSLCCPSRASMFTGQHPHNTGVLSNKDNDHGGYQAFRPHENRTYATALDQAGYRTGYLGKYINEYPLPANYEVPPGWDEWHAANGGGYGGFDYQVADYVREEQRHQRGDGNGKYFTDLLGERAVEFLDRTREHAPGDPFFLQVSAFSPHSGVDSKPGEPRFPPAPRDRPGAEFPHGDCGSVDCQSLDVTDLPAFDEDTGDKPAWVRREPLDEKLVAELNEDFRNRVRMVQSLDDTVGRVLGALTPEERNSTYVVFASDNGFHLGQHRLPRGKMTAYDHDVRLPLLIRRPGNDGDPAATPPEIAQNVDLFPTFLDIAGAPPQDPRDGRSLLGLASGETPPDWRTAAFIEQYAPNPDAPGEPDPDGTGDREPGNPRPPSYQAIRLEQELLVEYAGGEREYYDLAADPAQESNVPAHPRAEALTGPLHTLATCGRPGSLDCWTAAHVGG